MQLAQRLSAMRQTRGSELEQELVDDRRITAQETARLHVPLDDAIRLVFTRDTATTEHLAGTIERWTGARGLSEHNLATRLRRSGSLESKTRYVSSSIVKTCSSMRGSP